MAKVVPADIAQFLEHGLVGDDVRWSRSSRLIASYLRDHWHNLPFETGASIATATGLSEMTVIRFIRQIGFSNLKELKDAIKAPDNAAADGMDNAFNRFQVHPLADTNLADSLQLELQAVSDAYKLTTLPRWKLCTDLLAYTENLSVIGFQASKGLALDFASRLQYVRGHVRYIEDTTGVFPEIFDYKDNNHCLLLVDTYSYSRKGILLAEQAKSFGIPLIIVTDKFTNWAYDHTELVLQASTYVKEFWDSPAGISVILNLLIGGVANALGPRARERTQLLKELGNHFNEFSTGVSPRSRS